MLNKKKYLLTFSRKDKIIIFSPELSVPGTLSIFIIITPTKRLVLSKVSHFNYFSTVKTVSLKVIGHLLNEIGNKRNPLEPGSLYNNNICWNQEKTNLLTAAVMTGAQRNTFYFVCEGHWREREREENNDYKVIPRKIMTFYVVACQTFSGIVPILTLDTPHLHWLTRPGLGIHLSKTRRRESPIRYGRHWDTAHQL